jgi:hypothetical protein
MRLPSWLTGRGREAATKRVAVAKELFNGFVESPEPWGKFKEAEFTATLWPRFQTKWRLYRGATVLAALISRAEKDGNFRDLAKAYGRLIHGDPSTPEGTARIAGLDAAIRDINSLLDVKDDQATEEATQWSIHWFEKIGELPHNPATCFQFGLECLDFCIAVENVLNKMEAEGIVP